MDQLKPTTIQSFYDKLRESGRLDGKGGLSPKTIHNIHGVLHSALEQALKLQLISTNPAEPTEVPRMSKPEIKIASDNDVSSLLVAIEKSKYRVPIMIALSTAMRRGEVLGLRWKDFDAKRRTLVVRRSLSQVKGRVFTKEPKSGKSRVILMPDFLIELLEKHRQDQKTSKLLLGDEYKDEGWICANDDGKVLTPGGIDRAYSRLSKAAGIKVTLHGLRHTQATQLIMAGVPVKVVSERLGHSTISITQDIYAHVMPHMQERAVDVIESTLGLLTKNKKPSDR